MSGKRRRIGLAPWKKCCCRSLKTRGDDITEAPAFPKEGRDVCQNAVRFDLTRLRRSEQNRRRWRACRSGAGAVFERVPPGLRLGDDACIFQRYVPDGRLMRDLNSGRSKVKGKEKQKKKKERVQMTTKVVIGEVTGDFAYVESPIYYAIYCNKIHIIDIFLSQFICNFLSCVPRVPDDATRVFHCLSCP